MQVVLDVAGAFGTLLKLAGHKYNSFDFAPLLQILSWINLWIVVGANTHASSCHFVTSFFYNTRKTK